MNVDIRLQVTWYSNLKRIKLQRILGAAGPLAFIDLLIYAGMHRPTGNLTSMDEDDIEDAAQWDGEKGKFIETLLDLNFLEKKEKFYALHEWKEHNTYASKAPERSKSASRAAKVRHSKDAETGKAQCGKAKPAVRKQEKRNAPSPSPIPSNTVKSKKSDEIGDLLGIISSRVAYTIGSLQASDIVDLESKLGSSVAISEFEKCVEWYDGKNQTPRILQIISWLDRTLVERSPKPQKEFTPSVIDPVALDPFSKESQAIIKAREENANKS